MIKCRLKELIEESNIKPHDLAKSINLKSKSKIYDYLNGNRFPNYENLIKIVDYFNCGLDYFLYRTEENNETKFKQCPPFDEQLKKIMKEYNVSQYKMIKDKLVNPSHFHKWFNNKSHPLIDNLIKLADYFNMSIDELIGRV